MRADPETETEVWAVCERSIEAYLARDPRVYMALWAPDDDIVYIGSGPDEIGMGRGPIEAINSRTISEADSMNVASRWHVTSREGPVSWVTGESDVRVVVQGDPFDFRFRATFILVLRDKTWQIVNAHYSVPDRDIVE